MKSKTFGNAYEKLYLITPMVYNMFKDCISEKQKDNLDHLNQTYTEPILENSDNDLSTLDTALDSEMTELTTAPNSSVENEGNMTLTNDTVSVDSVPSLDPTESNSTAPASIHNSADASTQISAGSNLPKTIKYVNASTEMDNKKYVESSTQMNNKEYVDSVSQTEGRKMSPSSTQTNDFVENDDSHTSEFKNNQSSHPTYPNLSNENCNNNNNNNKSNKFKPFICTQCSKSYTTSSSLNRHRKNVHNIALPPKRLKKKTTKSVITREQLSKELKKVMKSKVGNEGKKNNQSMTLPKVTLVNTPSRKRKVSEVNHPNDEELFQASAPEKKRHRFHTRANKESDGIIFKTWPKRK